MEKAVFLDRDGTINEDVGYVCKIEDFEFLPGALQGLKMLQDAGYLLVIITNQSGIARGYFTEREYRELEHYMFEKFRKSGISVAGSYYCPHHPEGKIPEYRCICPCRKPEIGLFIRAAKEHDIDFSQSFAIGDKLRDLAICEKKHAGVIWWEYQAAIRRDIYRVSCQTECHVAWRIVGVKAASLRQMFRGREGSRRLAVC